MKNYDEIMNQLQKILNAHQEVVLGIAIGIAVIGLIVAFFGLKLTRVLNVLIGLLIGAAAGLAVVAVFGLIDVPALAIIAAGGIIMAVLCGVFYRFGSFLWSFVAFTEVIILLVPVSKVWIFIVAVVLALVYAILTAIYPEPFMIIVTALWGGAIAGTGIVAVAGYYSHLFRVLVFLIVTVIGIAIQFHVRSREIGKKEKIQSEKVKESVSRETEVEMARQILEDVDESEEVKETEKAEEVTENQDIEDQAGEKQEESFSDEKKDDIFEDGKILEFDYENEEIQGYDD